MSDRGTIGVSINAGHIEATGHSNGGTHQIRMGDGGCFIHIKPEMARQWIQTLTPIAEEN